MGRGSRGQGRNVQRRERIQTQSSKRFLIPASSTDQSVSRGIIRVLLHTNVLRVIHGAVFSFAFHHLGRTVHVPEIKRKQVWHLGRTLHVRKIKKKNKHGFTKLFRDRNQRHPLLSVNPFITIMCHQSSVISPCYCYGRA